MYPQQKTTVKFKKSLVFQQQSTQKLQMKLTRYVKFLGQR